MRKISESTARYYYKLYKAAKQENKRLNAGLNQAMEIITNQVEEMAEMRNMILDCPLHTVTVWDGFEERRKAERRKTKK